MIHPTAGAHSRWTDGLNEWLNEYLCPERREKLWAPLQRAWPVLVDVCYLSGPTPPSLLCNCTFPLVNCPWSTLHNLRGIDSQGRPTHLSLLRCWTLRRVGHRGGHGRSPGPRLEASWETITSYDPDPQGCLTYSSSQHLSIQPFCGLLSLPAISPINPYYFA